MAAILWVLLSTFLWTLIFAAGKFADGGIGAFQLTFLRYCGALVMLLVLAPRQGGVRVHRSQQPMIHLARAVSGCGAAVAITWASANMPLVDATAIGMLYGVLAILLGTVVLKETVSRTHWVAVIVSLVGVGTVMFGKGAFQGGLSILPALVAFTSAAFFAIEGLLISLLGRSERAFTVMLYVTFFGVGLMLVPAMLEWQSISLRRGVICLLLGPLGLAGQYCTIRGYRSAPLSVVAPVDYSWLLFSVILGIIFFQEVPDTGTWIGCFAIILGGVLLARSGGRK
ncbi:DMT family transporter [uncultured Tateyamaria sp.]|uniref:DMT family transporter n=1 Tax=uncultured Tateyamaria sp. TaxID=455651 RepID=UPI002614569C|nr:DMT family transporter [uncultured Tateyamaria sp.]